jgi:hypothetical protein
MNTNVVLRLRHALIKKDSARRIDRVIDFFGENPPARRPRPNGGALRGMKRPIRTIAALGLAVGSTPAHAPWTLSLSHPTRPTRR